MLLSYSGAAMPLQFSTLDSLEAGVAIRQDSLVKLEALNQRLENRFQMINQQVSELKQALATSNNPLTRLNLNNRLKTSRQMADSLAENNVRIRNVKIHLQRLYNQILVMLDQEIERLLASRKAMPNDSQLKNRIVRELEALDRKKERYRQLLESETGSRPEWQSLQIEASDTPQRISLKINVLRDQRIRFLSDSLVLEQQLQTLLKDRNIYRELLAFYGELSTSVEDEQEFFDRNRIDEIKDRLDTLSDEILTLKSRKKKIITDMILLNEKIQEFTAVLQDKRR